MTPLENVTVYENEEGIFECTISKPKANIQWTYDDQPIKSNEKYTCESNAGTLRLKIRQCTKQDEGNYQCKINDRKTNAQLFVKGKIYLAINQYVLAISLMYRCDRLSNNHG